MFTINSPNKTLALSISILIYLMGSFVFAGTTGKIAGKITDQTTAEALIGANIIVIVPRWERLQI